jgi:hypothetical protein
LSTEIKTVTTSNGRIFDLARKMADGAYSASKAMWLKALKLRAGQTTAVRYMWASGYSSAAEATKHKSGAISFGCMRFSPTAVNKIRIWAGLRPVSAKSRKTRKTR